MCANVLTFHKKGSFEDPSKFRPLSLFSSMKKVIEKMLFNRLLKCKNKMNFLEAEQFGFSINFSCIDPIIKATEKMGSCKVSKNIKKTCFIFFEKPFDTID